MFYHKMLMGLLLGSVLILAGCSKESQIIPSSFFGEEVSSTNSVNPSLNKPSIPG